MRKLLIGLALAAAAFAGAAIAQVPGSLRISPIQFTAGTGAFPFLGPAQTSTTPVSGGTFTCTGGGTITVANSQVTANTVVAFGLKTAGGTVAAPFEKTVTVGTGFTVGCGGSDTSIYSYLILG